MRSVFSKDERTNHNGRSEVAKLGFCAVSPSLVQLLRTGSDGKRSGRFSDFEVRLLFRSLLCNSGIRDVLHK